LKFDKEASIVAFDTGLENIANFYRLYEFSTMQIDTSPVRVFQERTAPEGSRLVGWSALVHALGIQAPVRHPCAVSEQHIHGSRRPEGEDWVVFDKRYWPGEGFGSHLGFALRHEDIDLLILKRLFDAVPPEDVQEFVRSAPTGVPARRVWYLYEQFTGRTLDIPELPVTLPAVDLLDREYYFTGTPRLSRRHRVRDNLLGTARFCPMIRRTKHLVAFVERDLGRKAHEIIGRAGANVVARAASFLLLADSRASFAIEGERPPRGRLERWARAVLQAGKTALTLDEIIRLHDVLIEDRRFARAGLRPEGVFLGQRDDQGDPLPEFIGARAQDLEDLVGGLIETNDRMRATALDPVLKAAATAFGFVYVHPFEDGNGRLHRCLIHHVLAERKFTPQGMVFPVSSVMLTRIDEYRGTLQRHSGPLMNFTEWRPTPDRNVEVLNETADFYRYFDCTDNAEFLYGCVEQTIEHDLPQEIDYLRRHDEAMRRIMDLVEMPDRIAENLLMFIRKNNGRLGKKRRENEFAKLTEHEVSALEAIVREAFEGFPSGG
jgi:Fic/DOC family